MTDAAGSMTSLRLLLTPLDVLFFRDARPFDAGSRASSGLPRAQTLTGAVRTLLLDLHGIDPSRLGARVREFGNFGAACTGLEGSAAGMGSVSVRGPWFNRGKELLLPAPANLRLNKETGKPVRIDPISDALPCWSPGAEEGASLWRRGRGRVEGFEGFLTPSGMNSFLSGGVPAPEDLVVSGELFGFDARTGIAIDPISNSAASGQIYAASMLSLKPGVTLVAELEGPEGTLAPLLSAPRLMRFGGESRQVIVKAEEGNLDWPLPDPGRSDGQLAVLTAPADPETVKSAEGDIIALSVNGYEAISGWDLAAGAPKPNRFMMPAGTVLFFGPGSGFPTKPFQHHEDAHVGWGVFLEGKWAYV